MQVVTDIVNEQDKMEIEESTEELISNVILRTLDMENFPEDCYVAVTLTDNENIRVLNNEQRGIDKETDVLSFPVLEYEDGEMIAGVGDYYEDKLILGDIVISVEKAIEQSKEFGHSPEREIGYLVCHSVLHLLGYDHETDEDREVMRRKEEETLETLSLTR